MESGTMIFQGFIKFIGQVIICLLLDQIFVVQSKQQKLVEGIY